MVGARVVRVALQDRLEDGDDLERVLARLVPSGVQSFHGCQVHQALGVERGGVEVVGYCAESAFIAAA